MKDLAPKPGEYFCMRSNVIFASREEHDANCTVHDGEDLERTHRLEDSGHLRLGEYFCNLAATTFRSKLDHDENCTHHGRVTGYAKLEAVDHPSHYGGKDNPHETIKCIEAWGLGYALGNAVKYISRAGKKGDILEDLKKAAWYINHAIEQEEAERG